MYSPQPLVVPLLNIDPRKNWSVGHDKLYDCVTDACRVWRWKIRSIWHILISKRKSTYSDYTAEPYNYVIIKYNLIKALN